MEVRLGPPWGSWVFTFYAIYVGFALLGPIYTLFTLRPAGTFLGAVCFARYLRCFWRPEAMLHAIYVGFALLGPILHVLYAGPWIYRAGAGFSRFCCPAQKLLQRPRLTVFRATFRPESVRGSFWASWGLLLGGSWALLGAPGGFWGLLGAPVRSWALLGAPGRS